jgi:hypothetical protein
MGMTAARIGASSKRTTVEVSALSKPVPWDGVKSYARKDYADFLD